MGNSFAPCGSYGDGVEDTTPHHGASGGALVSCTPSFLLSFACSLQYILCGLPLWNVCGSGSVLLSACTGGSPMDFYAILDQVIDVLRQRQRVTYRALKRQFNFDDDYLEDVKVELIQGQRLAVDEEGAVLVWTSDARTAPTVSSKPVEAPVRAPLTYTPPYLV